MTIDIESGGPLLLESGGALLLESGDASQPASGGQMKIGLGASFWNYYASDDKDANKLNPLAAYFPRRGGSTYDAAGWPLTVDPANFTDWLYLLSTERYIKPGRYRVDALGSGTLALYHPDLPGGGINITFNAPTPGARSVGGEYDLHTPGGSLAINATSATDHLRDVRIYRTDIDPSKTFTPEYLADMALFAAVRIAGWPGVIDVTDADNPSPSSLAKWKAGIELANAIKKDVWINFPHEASDKYIQTVAKLYADTLAPGINVYLEYSNEIWNWFGPFGTATKAVDDWRKANMPNCTLGQAYVYKAAHLHKVFAAAAPGVSIVRLIAFQHMDPGYFRDALAFMGGTVGEITFPSGIASVPAGGFKFDAVATAPYADAQTHCDFTRIGALMTSGVAADKETAYSMMFDAYYATIADNERASLEYRTLMDGLGMRAIVYECAPGLSFDPTGIPPWQAELLTATYDDPRMSKFMTEAYYPYMARYYDLVMYTQDADLPTPGKYWGIKKNRYDNTSPKWLATIGWISRPQEQPMATAPVNDGGFETVKVGAGQFKYVPTGSPWTFVGNAGIAANGSGFTQANPKAPDGTQVAFLQVKGWMSTTLATADGSYQLTFLAAQRATFNTAWQDLEVLVNDVSVGKFSPLGKNYQTFTTSTFKGTSHKVVITGLNTAGGDNTALVDKVSLVTVAVTPTPTPTPAPTPAPTGLAASATSPTAVAVIWDPVAVATIYSLQRSLDAAAWAEIARPAKGVLTYADSGLTPSTAYSYRAAAIGDGGTSPYSAVVSVTTPAPPPPPPPAPDLAAESADVSAKVVAIGDAIAALAAQVDALKAAASKLATDSAKKP